MKYELILPDGRRFLLKKEWTKIGRAEDNDLVITNSTVSRYHVNLYVKPEGVIAENAGSQAGFFVNNELINDPKALAPGDILYLGNAYLVFAREGETPTRKNTAAPKADESQSLYNMATSSSAKGIKTNNNKRIIIYGSLAAVFIFLMTTEDKSKPSQVKSNTPDAPLAFGIQPLPADGYAKDNLALRSEDEIRAEGKYQEGLRDYYDQNYGRARLSFQEAIEFNPNHAKSIEYLAKTDAKMLDSINAAIRDAEQSYGLGQYRRARWQASTALGYISQQIPGYARKLAQESDQEAIKRSLSQGQEESLISIPCDQSPYKDKCKTALSILMESRRILGDEDLIKRYEQ